jgi:DNA-binding NtrC family response regulator
LICASKAGSAALVHGKHAKNGGISATASSEGATHGASRVVFGEITGLEFAALEVALRVDLPITVSEPTDETAQPDTDRLSQGGDASTTPASFDILDGARGGEDVILFDGDCIIGSGARVDLRIPDRGVSKRHAQLRIRGGLFVLKDLASTNGTFVNGARIGRAYLSPGDIVTVGTCRLRFGQRPPATDKILSPHDSFGPLYGSSTVMRQLFGVAERIARGPATVLIQGKSGTGKDLLARAVHDASPRAAKPYVVFDCSAVSEELISSELFGHVPGAFTGAQGRRRGAFESATEGTLFLDEVGELPLSLQPKLLRALESKEVRPVGADRPTPVNVRVIAATNRDLKEMVKTGAFREDLYFRLAVIRLEMPPLERRREDIPGLAARLLQRIGGETAATELTADAIAALTKYDWPGNVRELRNVLERSLALAAGARLTSRDLALTSAAAETDNETTGLPSLEQSERDLILRTLAHTAGNRAETARLLGIHRETLREKMRRHGISATRPRAKR